MKRAQSLVLVPVVLLGACSSSGVTVDVSLDAPQKSGLSPFESGSRLAFVRVGVDGADRFDEVYQDLDPGTRSASFTEYPVDRAVRVVANGFDELGNVVAYGELRTEVASDDLAIGVAFRRPLAYVIHRDICDGGCAADEVCGNSGDGHRCLPSLEGAMCGGCGTTGQVCARLDNGPRCVGTYAGGSQGVSRVYALDASSKALVDVITVPSPTMVPQSITNSGGDGVWVSFLDGGQPKAAFLSSSTHQWSTPFDLHAGAHYVIGAPGQPYVVAAGGGFVVAHAVEGGQEVRRVPVGGRILDGVIGGAGDKVLLVTSETLALLDLEVIEEAVALNPGELIGSAGVALSGDGRFAYVSSSSDGRIVAFDLISGGSLNFAERFEVPVRDLVFSERGAMVLGLLTSEPSVFVGAYSVPDQAAFPSDQSIGTLPLPGGLAASAGGSRVVVVSAGTSTGSAGLTVIDPVAGLVPTGSTILYPRDPTDTYTEGGNTFRQRYRPHRVAALYGQ